MTTLSSWRFYYNWTLSHIQCCLLCFDISSLYEVASLKKSYLFILFIFQALPDRSLNKLDEKEIHNRKNFVEQTKDEVKSIQEDISEHKPTGSRETAKSVTSLLNSNLNFGNNSVGILRIELE